MKLDELDVADLVAGGIAVSMQNAVPAVRGLAREGERRAVAIEQDILRVLGGRFSKAILGNNQNFACLG